MGKRGTWREQQFSAGSLQDIYSKKYSKDTTGLITAQNVTNMQQVAKIALSGKEGEKAVAAQLSRLRHVIKRRLEGFKNSPYAMQTEAYKKAVYELSRDTRKMSKLQKAQALTQAARWLNGQITSYSTGERSYKAHVESNLKSLQEHGYGFVQSEKDLLEWGRFMEFIRAANMEDEFYKVMLKAETLEEKNEITNEWFTAYLSNREEANNLLAAGKNAVLKGRMEEWVTEQKRGRLHNGGNTVQSKSSSRTTSRDRKKRKR